MKRKFSHPSTRTLSQHKISKIHITNRAVRLIYGVISSPISENHRKNNFS
ncbi:unnamed protein product [Meloidogyne enterolobii]|uniref:Uncharacterized protein n=2 Tax=Meloidogyne enterolobii TaxID=390850 RepID=A0A6V7XD22_MELEN|nr:unnamed protein product [Meloidogyne enterolobii]